MKLNLSDNIVRVMVFTIALLFSCEDNSEALKRNEYGSTGSPGNSQEHSDGIH